MNRLLSLALVGMLVGCGSTKVVWPADDVEEDSLFQFDENEETDNTVTPHDIKPQQDQTEDDIIYSDNTLLEYYEQYGDSNVKCQGFSDPPSNTQKIVNCDFEMSFQQVRAFKVVFLVDGKPVQGQQVDWELEGDKDPDTGASIVNVDTLSSGTDGEGIATIKASTEDIAGEFTIKAKAVSQFYSVQALYFHVKVLPKVVEPLTIKLKYDGAATIDSFNVYLFKQNSGAPACADILPDDPPFPAFKSGAVSSVTQSVKFTNFTELSAQNPKLYFTAIAIGSKANSTVALAYGCNDAEVIVEMGKSCVVTIVLKDIPPKYAGIYEVVNHFDMISALPDSVEPWVDLLIDFFNSPTAGLLKLTCKLASSALQGMCNTIFATPEDPDINQLTTIGTVIVQVVNSILYGLLADNVGSDILFTGKDVGNILRDLEIYSTMTISEEPDTTGYLTQDYTEVRWETVAIQWTLGEDCNPSDPDCGLKSYSFNAIGQEVVIGHFNFQIYNYVLGQFDKMIIEPYFLNFKYGTFINFVVEKLVLPELAGDGSDGLPVVDTYEKFIKSLLAGKECLVYDDCCETFVQTIVDQTSPAIQGTLTAGCNALITLGVTYFQTWLVSLNTDFEALTLQTPDGNPCQLYDKNDDHIIDGLGSKDAPCMWKTTLNVMGADVVFDAEFWGNRVQ